MMDRFSSKIDESFENSRRVKNVENVPEFFTNVEILDYFGSFDKAFAKVES